MDGKLNYKNSRMYVGIGWSQGGRPYMQDAFTIVLNYDKDPCTDFLGVFDGHGPSGGDIARHVAFHLFSIVMRKYLKGHVGFTASIKNGFQELDGKIEDDLGDKHKGKVLTGGSTACAVWIRHGRCYCANVGDSRAVMSRRGRAVDVTVDHKPTNPGEKKRIAESGGFIIKDRVEGILGVARSFGDFTYKQIKKGAKVKDPVISVVPNISTFDIKEGVEFLVLATDGIWDVMTSQQVVDFILARVRRFVPLQSICDDLISECKVPFCTGAIPGGLAQQDNTTVVIGIFKH